eukprot:sb/3479009/
MRDEPPTTEDQNGTSPTPFTEDKLNDLLVPVEPYLENRIQEFGLEGEETMVQTPSLSEKLLERSGKIDYKFVIKKDEKEPSDEQKEHPWTEVRLLL